MKDHNHKEIQMYKQRHEGYVAWEKKAKIGTLTSI